MCHGLLLHVLYTIIMQATCELIELIKLLIKSSKLVSNSCYTIHMHRRTGDNCSSLFEFLISCNAIVVESVLIGCKLNLVLLCILTTSTITIHVNLSLLSVFNTDMCYIGIYCESNMYSRVYVVNQRSPQSKLAKAKKNRLVVVYCSFDLLGFYCYTSPINIFLRARTVIHFTYKRSASDVKRA